MGNDLGRLKTRIEKVEKQCGCDDDDQIVTLDFGGGVVFRCTQRQLKELLKSINGSRLLPYGGKDHAD
jgi:hypothetical protein